jgi:RNA polymerase sigma-70 factor (ECF subfamily)
MSTPQDSLQPEVLARIRTGDREAFELLFRAWYPRLADYAARLLASRDAAEDAVQEVFVAVWGRRERLPEGTKLPAYLHRAVKNRALNQIRSYKTSNRWLEQEDHQVAVIPVGVTEMENEELNRALKGALDNLSPRGREVFLLSRHQGLTYPQIADTLGISVKTVETLMSRALKSLREQLLPRLLEDG